VENGRYESISGTGYGEDDDEAAGQAGDHPGPGELTVPSRRGRRGADAPVSPAPEETIPPRSEVEGGPETPLELGETGWRQVLKRAVKEFTADLPFR
jgi:hypothetical protein